MNQNRGRGAFLAACLLWVGMVTPCCAATRALLFKRLLDGDGSGLSNPVILVESGRIKAVLPPGSVPPAGTEVIDLRRYTAIPGLIDVHTHLTYAWDSKSGKSPWQYLDTTPSPTLLILAQENARRTLQSGVTTVRDLSARDYLDIQIRDLIARGVIVGPRVLAAGYGLHPTLAPPKPGETPVYDGRADGAAEVMRVTREQIAAGADVIKLFGSTDSAEDLAGRRTFTLEEIAAATTVAHQSKLRVAFHSYGPEPVLDAVNAGVDSIEHAVDLDESLLLEMKKHQITYVPTIDHNRYYVDNKDVYGYGPDVVRSLEEFIQRNVATARLAHRMGVRVAMGSDAIFTMFGQNTRELGWLVKAGMTPVEALRAATMNGALLLGMEDRIGRIKGGYFADIVAVEGDPEADIAAVVNGVRWVMKEGQVVVDISGAAK